MVHDGSDFQLIRVHVQTLSISFQYQYSKGVVPFGIHIKWFRATLVRIVDDKQGPNEIFCQFHVTRDVILRKLRFALAPVHSIRSGGAAASLDTVMETNSNGKL